MFFYVFKNNAPPAVQTASSKCYRLFHELFPLIQTFTFFFTVLFFSFFLQTFQIINLVNRVHIKLHQHRPADISTDLLTSSGLDFISPLISIYCITVKHDVSI